MRAPSVILCTWFPTSSSYTTGTDISSAVRPAPSTRKDCRAPFGATRVSPPAATPPNPSSALTNAGRFEEAGLGPHAIEYGGPPYPPPAEAD